ncbi:MAG: discoidin domain-containing protein [Candidatus Omnitrophica bacterium]|nr:discoidin domain-containing protein [Candidatus Omnitrophota bacterium]MBU1889837.1 discoidin domain-containing protein [Candidatus Omnitrophota bacterium]
MSANRVLLYIFFLVFFTVFSTGKVNAQGQMLDDFETIQGWKIIVSDGVTLNIASDKGFSGNAIRLDFNFVAGAGYAIIQKHIPLDLPDNYRFTFYLRADAPVNNFEFKLLDPTDNVWWNKKVDVEFPRDWQKTVIRKRNISFAWGPDSKPLSELDRIEFVVSAGKGGKGSVYIDNFTFEPIEKPDNNALPVVAASSTTKNASPENVIDNNLQTVWRSSSGKNQWFLFDFKKAAEYDSIVINWDNAYASDYQVLTSNDGQNFDPVFHVRNGNGQKDYIYLGECESRFLKLIMNSGPQKYYGIRSLEVIPIDADSTLNKLYERIAADAPGGHFPKYFDKKQTYWTIIGPPEGNSKKALINQEGAIEIDKAGFSIEPFLFVNNRLITWADVSTAQSLENGYLPIPSVLWQQKDIELKVTAWAAGKHGAYSIFSNYRISNPTERTVCGTFFLAIRPFQVLPPSQWLNLVGGTTKIKNINFDGYKVSVDDRSIVLLAKPDRFIATQFADGDITEYLTSLKTPAGNNISDETGLGSAALGYRFNLKSKQYIDIVFEAPFDGISQLQQVAVDERMAFVRQTFNDAKTLWQDKLDKIDIILPASAQQIVQTLKTNIGYILICRNGAAIEPGARTYDRSWIRDGSEISTALLRTGNSEEVREYIDWYAEYQYPNGKIPCVVDWRGADPTNEYDSTGQFIYLTAEYFRFMHDIAHLRKTFPKIIKSVEYIESLHNQRKTELYLSGTPEQQACYGLVPESISHEGYSAKPMHSYWDDFYIIKGLKDAVEIANALGEKQLAGKWAEHLEESQENLYASMRKAIANTGINFIPGCVEKGDFDATSTAIGIGICGELNRIPQPFLNNTFDKWFDYFTKRRDGTIEWKDYTPYEMRIISAFVLMGQKERANELLEYFLKDRRPPSWNHWAEVVWRDPNEPQFIGDMPHTWIGSGFINAVRTMFVYEQTADNTLVIGAGIPENWLKEKEPIAIRNFPTYYCIFSVSMQKSNNSVIVDIQTKNKVSLVKVVLKSPLAAPIKSVVVDGKTIASFTPDEVLIDDIPSRVVIYY